MSTVFADTWWWNIAHGNTGEARLSVGKHCVVDGKCAIPRTDLDKPKFREFREASVLSRLLKNNFACIVPHEINDKNIYNQQCSVKNIGIKITRNYSPTETCFMLCNGGGLIHRLETIKFDSSLSYDLKIIMFIYLWEWKLLCCLSACSLH